MDLLPIVVAATLLGCGRSTPSSSSEASSRETVARAAPEPGLRAAVERGAAYFDHRLVRGDEGWLVTQGAASLGPVFQAWAASRLVLSPSVQDLPDAAPFDLAAAEARLWNLRGLPEIDLPVSSAPRGAPPAAAVVAHTDAEISAVFHVMTDALGCTQTTPDGGNDVLADVREAGHGYVLTHQLFALVLAANQRCLDGPAVESLRRTLAEATWREQAADGPRVHDLAFERMAVLCYAQVCDWLEPSWIAAVIREQGPSGSWGERDLHVNRNASAGESHTAALGFYVLAKTWSARHGAGEGPQPPRAQ